MVGKMRKVCGNIPRKVGECKVPLLQHTHTASLKNSAFRVSNSSKGEKRISLFLKEMIDKL